MSKRILFQFDSDPQPSSFDAVVAIDSDVDHLISHGNVQPTTVEPLVHGTMFTRGGDNLKNTAIFIGGSDVSIAENLLRCVIETFFGPVRVSVMMDANGCNTTAAAAVVAASRHVPLAGAKAIVLGGTGPVGQRVARLLVQEGATVALTSRSLSRAQQACQQISDQIAANTETSAESYLEHLVPAMQSEGDAFDALIEDVQIVVACGAAGVQLASNEALTKAPALQVAIDLNAVPPAGLQGIGPMDKAKTLGEASKAVGYGPIGVGGLKMKTHQAAIRSLFERNDAVLNAEEIFALAKAVDAK